MKIDKKIVELGTVITVNGEDYEVISLEEDWCNYENNGVINCGEIVDLHKIGDHRLGVPTPTHFIYFNNKNRKLSFKKNEMKPDLNVPKNIKPRGYICEQIEIPIGEITIR